jgi:membrane protease YdiL (CAAX protease family)
MTNPRTIETTVGDTCLDTHGATPHHPGRRRRIIEGVGFVAIWMTLGFTLSLDDNMYLLLGIPLTVAFQVLVRRRPLRELWAAGPSRFSLDRRGKLIAAALMLTPVYFLTRAVAQGDWVWTGVMGATIVGSVAAAFAIRATTITQMLRTAVVPTTVGVLGMSLVLGGAHIAQGVPFEPVQILTTVLRYLLVFFPALFLLEEVAFRGALDAHVHHAGESRGWGSALLVSAVWGLWHLPMNHGPMLVTVASLLTVHCLIGIPLSFAWRRTHNLAGLAFAHATIDAVRNALLIGL